MEPYQSPWICPYPDLPGSDLEVWDVDAKKKTQLPSTRATKQEPNVRYHCSAAEPGSKNKPLSHSEHGHTSRKTRGTVSTR